MHFVLGYADAQKDCYCKKFYIGERAVSSSCWLENEYSGCKLHASTNIFHNTLPQKKCMKFQSGHCMGIILTSIRRYNSGEKRGLHVYETLVLSSGGKKYGCPIKKTVSSRALSTKFMWSVTQGNLSKPGTQIWNHFPEKSSHDEQMGPLGLSCRS